MRAGRTAAVSAGKVTAIVAAAAVVLAIPLGIVGLSLAEGESSVAVASACSTANPLLASPDGASPPPPPVAADGTVCDGGDGLPDSGGGGLPAGFVYPTDAQQARVVAYALAQLGKPYVFGADGPNAFDCSGLVMMAWRQVGVHLTHWTGAMVNEGVAVGALAQMQPGDLIFIPGSDGTMQSPGHVGMYIGRGDGGQQFLVQAPHTGTVVKVTPVSQWASEIAKIVRPVLSSG